MPEAVQTEGREKMTHLCRRSGRTLILAYEIVATSCIEGRKARTQRGTAFPQSGIYFRKVDATLATLGRIETYCKN